MPQNDQLQDAIALTQRLTKHQIRGARRWRPLCPAIGSSAAIASLVGAALANVACHCSSCSATSSPWPLHRWAWDRAVGAIHAAITGFWFEQCVAVLAFVVPLTGLGRHRFQLGMAANRAGQQRFQAWGVRSCLAHAFHSDGKRRCGACLGRSAAVSGVRGLAPVFDSRRLAD